jgi:hypothetical protein
LQNFIHRAHQQADQHGAEIDHFILQPMAERAQGQQTQQTVFEKMQRLAGRLHFLKDQIGKIAHHANQPGQANPRELSQAPVEIHQRYRSGSHDHREGEPAQYAAAAMCLQDAQQRAGQRDGRIDEQRAGSHQKPGTQRPFARWRLKQNELL